jgi:glycosyltransferase involved in cell wall biosynthesis
MMDVFCLVSYREGLPISVMEAMAAELPVIGTDIDGIRSVVDPGVNGLLVPPDDVEALTRSLDRLLGDANLRSTMGTASGRLARERYSLKRCVEETEALFLTVLSDGRRQGSMAESDNRQL